MNTQTPYELGIEAQRYIGANRLIALPKEQEKPYAENLKYAQWQEKHDVHNYRANQVESAKELAKNLELLRKIEEANKSPMDRFMEASRLEAKYVVGKEMNVSSDYEKKLTNAAHPQYNKNSSRVAILSLASLNDERILSCKPVKKED